MTRRDGLSRDLLPADETTNLALWLDRYAWSFEQEHIHQHHTSTLDKIRVPEGYPQAFERKLEAIRAFRGAYQEGETRVYELKLEGRAVVGIGAASVRETNLSLLRPWGVPFIPGSALKGLASHVAHEAGGDWSRPPKAGEKAGELQRALFGDVTAAGAVVFHDAWWKPADQLPISQDTMTVHHADYYQGKAAPLDWDEPNPVGFLTMHGTYLAALTGPGKALDVVEGLLRRGLEERGVGAKTAAGYGRAKLERRVSETLRALNNFTPAAAQAGNVQQQAEAFLKLARKTTDQEEERAAQQAAQRILKQSPEVWKTWVSKPVRTEEERRWFTVAAPSPARPAEAVVLAPTPTVTPPSQEQREVRVKYIGKKDDKRYELEIALGDKPKKYKGHLVTITPEDLQRVKDAGAEGALVKLELEGNEPRRPLR